MVESYGALTNVNKDKECITWEKQSSYIRNDTHKTGTPKCSHWLLLCDSIKQFLSFYFYIFYFYIGLTGISNKISMFSVLRSHQIQREKLFSVKMFVFFGSGWKQSVEQSKSE